MRRPTLCVENSVALIICPVTCALPFALGIGLTLLTRKRFPRGAYWFGFLVPVLIPIALWFLYTRVVSAQPCSPENQLACGEGDAYVFLLLGGVLLFNFGISATIQFVMWLLARRKLEQQTT